MIERLPDLLLIGVIAITLMLLPYLAPEERSRDERRGSTEELNIRPPRK
jgi:hypothetical protein